jgi:hypothetical protein
MNMTWSGMKWVRLLLTVIGLLLTIAVAAYLMRHQLTRMVEGLPAFTHRAGDSFEQMVTMGDGVELFTTVQLPGGEGPFPMVLIRSPYADVSLLMRNMVCGRFVRYGYGCVVQDVRGQGRSEGEWDPGVNYEIDDGRDALAWREYPEFCVNPLSIPRSLSYPRSVSPAG